MISEFGLAGGPGFEPPLCNLNLTLVYLKIHEGLFGLFDSQHAGAGASMGPHVREGVKEYDIHIKFKSYKLELLGELVV